MQDQSPNEERDALEAHDYTVQQVCGLIVSTPPTVYKLLAQGKLDGYTVGRSRRITRESVQRLRSGR